MPNQIDAVKQFQVEIAKITNEMKLLHSEVLSVSKATREAADSLKGMKSPKGVNDAIKKANENTEQLNATLKEQDKLEKNLISTIAKKELATESTNRAVIKQRLELQQQNKLIKEASILQSKHSSLLQKSSVLRNQLARKIQDLNVKKALGNKLSKEEVEVLRTSEIAFKKYDSAVRKAKESVGRFQENVGNYPKNLAGSVTVVKNLAGSLGLLDTAFLALSGVRDAFNRIREFDKAMDNLSGILRTNRADLKDLEDNIISVAGASVRTSNEVAALATSLITLGKSKDEVKDLLQPVTDLSLGLNSSAEDAGAFLVQMLNSFGATSAEAAKYADTIATIRTSTSLDFQKMRDSFAYIAPVAKVLGKDLAQVGAEVGILTDNGLKAESSGRLLASSYQRMAKRGIEMKDALKEINDAQVKGIKGNDLLAIASKSFGTESAKIGIILANNTGIIDTNAQAIRDNTGALDDLVNEQLKSLDSSLKILSSRWEEYILKQNDATGAAGLMTTAINFLSDNLSTIINTVLISVTAWGAYKLAVMLATLQTKLANIELFNSRKAALASAKGISKASIAFRGFNKVLKANAIGIAIAGITLLIGVFNKYNKTLIENTDELNKSNKELEGYAKETNNVNDKLGVLVGKYNALKGEAKDNEKAQKDLKTVIGDIAKIVPEATTAVDEYGNAMEINTKKVDAFVKSNNRNVINKATEALDEQQESAKFLTRDLQAVEMAMSSANATYVNGIGYVGTLNGQLIIFDEIVGRNGNTIGEAEEATRAQVIAFDNYVSKLRKSKRILDENIAKNKEIILNAKGLLSETQKNNKASAEEAKITADTTLIIPKLRKELAALLVARRELAKSPTVSDEALIKEKDAEISSIKARLSALLGLTKAKKKSREEAISLSDLLTKTEIENAEGITDAQKKQYIALQKLRKLANEPFDENGQILDPDKIQADVDKIVGDLKKIEDARKQLIADDVFKEALVDLADTFDQFTDVSGAKLLRFFDALDTNGKASLEELGEIASASFSLIGDVSNSFFQEKINKYDEDIEASNSYYDNLLANEENSEELNKRLTKDKEAAELKIKEKQKKEREKQFLADKAFAIAEIAVNTAVAVSKAAGQTGIFGLAASIPLIALGAVQTGIVLAQKMPKFAEGGTMQYDGAMMINDHSSGRLEVVERDGKLLMTDKRNAIVEGKAGDIIHKDAESYFKTLSDDDILNDAKNHSMIATITHQNNIANKLNSKKAKDVQKIQTDRIVNAIMSKKTQFKVQNNVSLSDDLRYLNASNEY